MNENLQLFASLPVNVRPRTDNEEVLNQKVSVITAEKMNSGKVSDFTQLFKDLDTAGIFVNSDGNITLRGNVKVVNGSTTVALFTDGSINANLINAQQIVTDGLQASSVSAGGIDAKYANINNLVVTNCRIDGVLASPFVIENYMYEWSDGKEYYAAKAHDNIIYNAGTHCLYWDTSCSGRTIYLVHHESVSGAVEISAPEGMYFYECGIKRKSINVSRQGVLLKGYGTDTKFLGYIVVQRNDVAPARMYGRNLNCLGFGIIKGTNTGATVEYTTFDGSALYVSRMGVGKYNLIIPNSWNIADGKLLAMATGFGVAYGDDTPLYANVFSYNKYNNTTNSPVGSVTFRCGDDSSPNDGSIQFMLFNKADFETV